MSRCGPAEDEPPGVGRGFAHRARRPAHGLLALDYSRALNRGRSRRAHRLTNAALVAAKRHVYNPMHVVPDGPWLRAIGSAARRV
jgi:hypothetical protein